MSTPNVSTPVSCALRPPGADAAADVSTASRRRLLSWLAGAGVLAIASGGDPVSRAFAAAPASQSPEVLVYKTPTCGCCTHWIAHLRAAGFGVRAVDLDDLSAIRREWRVPPRLASCHTAKVGGYVVEGHVPATDIRRLLAQRPRVDGLSVPGMPIGSPGMEQGATVAPFDVLAFNAAGETQVFARHGR